MRRGSPLFTSTRGDGAAFRLKVGPAFWPALDAAAGSARRA